MKGDLYQSLNYREELIRGMLPTLQTGEEDLQNWSTVQHLSLACNLASYA